MLLGVYHVGKIKKSESMANNAEMLLRRLVSLFLAPILFGSSLLVIAHQDHAVQSPREEGEQWHCNNVMNQVQYWRLVKAMTMPEEFQFFSF